MSRAECEGRLMDIKEGSGRVVEQSRPEYQTGQCLEGKGIAVDLRPAPQIPTRTTAGDLECTEFCLCWAGEDPLAWVFCTSTPLGHEIRLTNASDGAAYMDGLSKAELNELPPPKAGYRKHLGGTLLPATGVVFELTQREGYALPGQVFELILAPIPKFSNENPLPDSRDAFPVLATAARYSLKWAKGSIGVSFRGSKTSVPIAQVASISKNRQREEAKATEAQPSKSRGRKSPSPEDARVGSPTAGPSHVKTRSPESSGRGHVKTRSPTIGPSGSAETGGRSRAREKAFTAKPTRSKGPTRSKSSGDGGSKGPTRSKSSGDGSTKS